MKQKHTYNEIRELAQTLMEKHLNDRNTLFMFEDGTFLGKYSQMKSGLNFIKINSVYALYANIEDIKDVILHEIAHALTPNKYRPHGKEWKTNAKKIGAIPSSTKELSVEFNCLVFKKKYHIYKCPSCGQI